jgi:hypothetical protein
MKPLPFRARLEDYEGQARELLEGHRTGAADAIRIIHENHPRFLDETIRWRPKFMSSADIQKAPFDLDDARLALARWYTFADWTLSRNTSTPSVSMAPSSGSSRLWRPSSTATFRLSRRSCMTTRS